MRFDKKILIVEDELITAENIKECLVRGGYRVAGIAGTADEALGMIANEPPWLALLDIKLRGGMDGVELARRIGEQYDVPVIFLTAFSDESILDRARDTMSYGYLIKPFEDRELTSNIEIAIHKHDADRRVRESELQLKDMNKKLRNTIMGIAEAMAMAVETRDPYTAGHQRRGADMATSIAREMGFAQDTVEGIAVAASIHDIGKLGVPAEILSKPSRLSEIEFKLIKLHPETGYTILKNIDFPWHIADMVHQHHEKMNGTGYPQGLAGDDILVEARIITIADVVEAIVSHRPYRAALGPDVAIDELKKNKGTLYDPGAVDACITVFAGGFTFPKVS